MENLGEFVNFLINFVIGAWIAHKILSDRKKESSAPSPAAQEENNEEVKEIIQQLAKSRPVYVEKYNEQFLMFDGVKHDFICQSSTLEELAERSWKWAKIQTAIVKYDDEYMMFREGVIVGEETTQ